MCKFGKNTYEFIVSLFLLLSLGFYLFFPNVAFGKQISKNGVLEFNQIMVYASDSSLSLQFTARQDNIKQETVEEPKVIKKKRVIITAYSSTPDQTDSTPFITASNTRVRDGVVAANFLPFGTKIKIPSVYGDKLFTVEDRMRSNKKVDIWFPTRKKALNFGVKITEIEILSTSEKSL